MPGYSREFERIACWRWMRWPDCEETRFCPKHDLLPVRELRLLDRRGHRSGRRKEAMKRGETFPEVERVFDDYRTPAAERRGR